MFETKESQLQHRPLIYGRRLARPLRQGKRQALQELWPLYKLEIDPSSPSLIIPSSLWQEDYTFYGLEIGFGNGDHLIQIAKTHPSQGWIGCEPFTTGVAAVLKAADDHRLSNLKVCQDDARLLLKSLATSSLDRVTILFPDPWPKARHHKRRIIHASTLPDILKVLKPNGELHCATDHPDYQEWIHDLLSTHPNLTYVRHYETSPDHPVPEDRPLTKYEMKAHREGRIAIYWVYRYTPKE